ncbi:Uncharacterised protein [Mycobacterium tuberculosis]|nr:Uncharacterised protein [Mycobacterium tuberculosis]
MGLDSIPEKRGVPRRRGTHHSVGIQIVRHRARRTRGLEFEDAPIHLCDVLVPDLPYDVLVDEPALAERGLLGSDDVTELGADADLLPGQ